MAKRRVTFTFPPELAKEPIIDNFGQQFKMVTNIRCVDVSESKGWIVSDLEGKGKEIEDGITGVTSKRMRVDPGND